ncbi:MAG: hypothetical protein OHK0015_06750 [Chloroflexi bacterium OHK40]
MFEVQAETEVDAPVAVVWAVLTDLSAYRAWSTMLHYRGGILAEGGTVQLRLTLPNGPSYNFAPQVIALEPERRFTWRAISGVRGVFDGEHSFELAPLAGGRTRLRNRELYRGLLAPLFQRLPMMRDAPAGFRAMNEEIRARAEALSGAARGEPSAVPPRVRAES